MGMLGREWEEKDGSKIGVRWTCGSKRGVKIQDDLTNT